MQRVPAVVNATFYMCYPLFVQLVVPDGKLLEQVNWHMARTAFTALCQTGRAAILPGQQT
jgi:hypothetical protein